MIAYSYVCVGGEYAMYGGAASRRSIAKGLPGKCALRARCGLMQPVFAHSLLRLIVASDFFEAE